MAAGSSPRDELLAFLNAKAGRPDEELKREAKTLGKLLHDFIQEGEEEERAYFFDLIEPLFPLLRKLDLLGTQSPCLQYIFIIIARGIPSPTSTELLLPSEVFERWLRCCADTLPKDVLASCRANPGSLKTMALCLEACQALVCSRRVSTGAKRRLSEVLRRILFTEELVTHMITQISHSRDPPQSGVKLVWPPLVFKTKSSNNNNALAIDFTSADMVHLCETSIGALETCLPESFAVLTKDELLILVNALNQPHNALAHSALSFFAAGSEMEDGIALQIAQHHLFASPPGCTESHAGNAKLFYTILCGVCAAQNNEHTNAFLTLCQAVQQEEARAHVDNNSVIVFVCGKLATLPWRWLERHEGKVLADIVYKLSAALVMKDAGDAELVLAACEAIQALGRCRALAKGTDNALTSWTGKLGALCCNGGKDSGLTAAAAAKALAWIASPNNRQVLDWFKRCGLEAAGEEICAALVERTSLEGTRELFLFTMQALWHFRAKLPACSVVDDDDAQAGMLHRIARLEGAIPRLLEYAASVGNVRWEAQLWDILLFANALSGGEEEATEIILLAEQSVCFSNNRLVQELACKALVKLGLVQASCRFLVYQVLHEYKQQQRDSNAQILDQIVLPALRVLDQLYYELDEFGTVENALQSAKSLGLALPTLL